ncbi:MAG: sulfite exporter TauE/SafE family protein [Nitrospinae bacterium]|nr:sulfite exporter TauE/SafE family protein [Nitrospinota bacterium]
MPFPLYDGPPLIDARRNAVALLIGLLAGAFGGLVGLGGGVVMIPLLTSLLGLGQHKAHGTSLAALVFTGLAGSAAYWRDGNVDFTAALFLAIPAVLTAVAGAKFAHELPESRLRRYLGVFLAFVSVMLLLKPIISPGAVVVGGVWKYAALTITGGLAGFISGMMGVGGGSIMVPAMVLLAGMGQHAAQGSALMAMIPTAAFGARVHWRLGNVATDIPAGLLTGIIIGSYLGGKLAGFAPDFALRILLAAVLAYVGVGYAIRRAA